jgi:hypothetical protein
MAIVPKPSDIFISSAPSDAGLALDVAHQCRAHGLNAFTHEDLPPGKDRSDAIWEALAECRASVMILSPSGLTPSMSIEIGGALAWNKPIYALVTDPASTRLPSHLTGVRLYPFSRLQDVIESIESSFQPFSDDDLALLSKLYADVGVPVDSLSLAPKALGDLVTRFNKGRGQVVSGERLLSELLRLRKRGQLAKRRPLARSSSKGKLA